MDPKLLDKARRYPTSRYLALVAGFTALYLVYGYASGLARSLTMDLDVFFLITALFTVLFSVTAKQWSGTLLGAINGLILLPEPYAPLGISLSLIPNGFVFDLFLHTRSRGIEKLSRLDFVIAGVLGNLAMAISGLLILLANGFFQNKSADFILTTSIFALVSNPIVGAIGALFGTVVVERLGERVRSPLIR